MSHATTQPAESDKHLQLAIAPQVFVRAIRRGTFALALAFAALVLHHIALPSRGEFYPAVSFACTLLFALFLGTRIPLISRLMIAIAAGSMIVNLLAVFNRGMHGIGVLGLSDGGVAALAVGIAILAAPNFTNLATSSESATHLR